MSRRNSYSDKDMFEVNDEEALVSAVAIGAIATGLGSGVGIRVCMLPFNEARAHTQSSDRPMAFDHGDQVT